MNYIKNKISAKKYKILYKNKEDEIVFVINNFLFHPLGYSGKVETVSYCRKLDLDHITQYDKKSINNCLNELKEKDKSGFKKLLSFCSIQYDILVLSDYEIDKNLFQFVAFLKDLHLKNKFL